MSDGFLPEEIELTGVTPADLSPRDRATLEAMTAARRAFARDANAMLVNVPELLRERAAEPVAKGAAMVAVELLLAAGHSPECAAERLAHIARCVQQPGNPPEPPNQGDEA